MVPRACRFRRTGLLALVLVAASTANAAAAPAARYALHAVQLEALPPALQQDRFVLRAKIEPASSPPAQAAAGPLRLTAMLAPKALVAQCPLPGAIFLDGFDLP